ncbi:MAG: hypothetical protein M5T61_18775, partial [Acidimicrobiia bacterium]|nr:hypothetical protein [Acidimicrobiia bacterium]
LRVIGRSAAEHLARTVALVAVALLWAPATFGLIALGGVDVTWVLPLWVSIVLGAVALVVPALEVRAEAAERRRSFRHALGCFLDLVAVRLAGGAGVDSALAGSAAAGDGWAFAELRQALTDARLRGEPSWNGLAHLGEAIGVGELQELAATAGLAGDEGARVRVSIAAERSDPNAWPRRCRGRCSVRKRTHVAAGRSVDDGLHRLPRLPRGRRGPQRSLTRKEPTMSIIPIMWAFSKARIELARHDERGEITEKVIIIAVFAALAIAVGAIVVSKVVPARPSPSTSTADRDSTTGPRRTR